MRRDSAGVAVSTGNQGARHVRWLGTHQVRIMVTFDQDRLADLCRQDDVRVLKLFGSAVRGEDRSPTRRPPFPFSHSSGLRRTL